jgi:hypothetical protein
MTKVEQASASLLETFGWTYRYVGNITPPGTFHALWTHPLLPGFSMTYDGRTLT